MENIYQKQQGENLTIHFTNNLEIYDDIEIYINHISIYGKDDLLIARLRINTAFLHK